ncbi:MAG: alpha/beta hydrolase [Gemmataceae bacterium]|nr:alpha/beta hydrolase [Gemmataceae bacterium]MDW8266584.1 alpha/beta fold hydrolase [Gemmataceae bacterium]
MTGLFARLGFLLVIGGGPVKTDFAQVFPVPKIPGLTERSPGQTRAVLLLHGLRPHVFREADVAQPGFQDWQQPGCTLVKALSAVADVYASAYGRNATVEDVAHTKALREAVGRLVDLGYQEVILVGHSAGGLIARQLVEDYPDLGVTKVIQVCPPNGDRPGARCGLVWNRVNCRFWNR